MINSRSFHFLDQGNSNETDATEGKLKFLEESYKDSETSPAKFAPGLIYQYKPEESFPVRASDT